MKRSLPSVEVSRTPVPSSDQTELPLCLKRLVRTIVRSFYSREHSLIIDLLVRNTIMKEDDLCERLRFEKKQLRQHLHTLKTDQFIKSKLQLETDTEGKIAKIIHYFIDYKVFVNIVKYRLDQMQRRLEAEQRQTSSRALFRCFSCNSAYTDLEVDRLLDPLTGALVCVYCRSEVKEEEDNAQRSDARALVAKFHQQVRGPLDTLLKECDQVHLSSSILEPEFRALEPLPGTKSETDSSSNAVDSRAVNSWMNDSSKNPMATSTESTVTIVLDAPTSSNVSAPKERPIWMSESTIDSGLGAGLGELDRGPTGDPSSTSDSTTQTLAPGRVPTSLLDPSSSSAPDGAQSSSGLQNSTSNVSAISASDIMQLLRVHERRGLGIHGPKTALNRPPNVPTSKASAAANTKNNQNSNSVNSHIQDASINSNPVSTPSNYVVKCGTSSTPIPDITLSTIKSMEPGERSEYVHVGLRLYRDTVTD
ncbi:General transcription factor IIE subunit 1 [Echinococcus granulosus]|uniref:General transcription factor IIE subunit n=1 Tax=Echinococcus granulosus TaxID=6210 RepID=U6J7Y2_ECHGR|nr:General transcription factor IIE subunit [Echinococcus granulosus]EUB63905.1 General transcription factor IIE subunit [Echinococcus granulosus]KAH9280821.1 General transcription factor IIE subunit 1 [Echinococcus granulosus]CDS19403.1 general transcription factor iie subunit 1 [Echinococcus granulosus]